MVCHLKIPTIFLGLVLLAQGQQRGSGSGNDYLKQTEQGPWFTGSSTYQGCAITSGLCYKNSSHVIAKPFKASTKFNLKICPWFIWQVVSAMDGLLDVDSMSSTTKTLGEVVNAWTVMETETDNIVKDACPITTCLQILMKKAAYLALLAIVTLLVRSHQNPQRI